MSKLLKKIIIFVGLCSTLSALDYTKTETFDYDWKFKHFGKQVDDSHINEPENVQANNFSDSDWRKLDLPHDWAIESNFLPAEPNETGKLLWTGIGWYRKNFKPDLSSKGNRFYLDFDGVMMSPKVYVNGTLAGEWVYGYNAFRVDITDLLKFDSNNVIAVRAENLPNSTRWYPGAGIYRHVWLSESNHVHIDHWGVFVHTPKINGITKTTKEFIASSAVVETETTVRNTTKSTVNYAVTQEVIFGGKVIVKSSKKSQVKANSTNILKIPLNVNAAKLWDIEKPNLYTLRTRVFLGNKLIDRKDTTFGIRQIQWLADGFYLNGRRVQIKGVCQHHDLGPLGSAVHARGYERQVEILKSFGVNSIRGAHNPPATELLEACDRLGVLFNNELFDIWKQQKYGKVNGYHRYWEQNHEKDLINFVHRDRNHASVICWSAGNEISEQGNAEGKEVAKRLIDLFHREDPTRLVTVGCNDAAAADNGFGDLFDIFGFNYKPYMYKNYASKNKPFMASETSSCVSSRGKYFFPEMSEFWNKNAGNAQWHVSSYDLYAPGWAYRPDIEFAAIDDCPQVAGEYVWTGFDYLGEPTPYNQDPSQENNYVNLPKKERERMMEIIKTMGNRAPSRSSYFGIVDLCGFPKDRYYIYQAQWMPELPMVHILPHWNWPDRIGKLVPIHIYTSGDEAELFINGKSQGRKKKSNTDKARYRLVWEDVIYQPGTVEVVSYKDGKVWAKKRVETTGSATKIRTEVDRRTILGDGRDLSYITIKLFDAKNRFVATADNSLKFAVKGPVEIVGVCNGDQTDMNSLKGDSVKAFSGMAQVILRSKRGAEGKAELIISGERLSSIKVPINVRKATTREIMTNR